jgi:hypothetical protein
MKKRFGRDTSAIKAHAAGILLAVDERDFHSKICCQECRRISAGAGADDRDVQIRIRQGVPLQNRTFFAAT